MNQLWNGLSFLVKESSNKNNIVIWPSSFHPVIGGVQTVAKEIGGFIHNKNWNVTFITNRYPRKLDKKDTIDSMKIYRFTFLQSPLNYLKSFRFDLVLGWIFYKPITCIKLISLFSKIFVPTVLISPKSSAFYVYFFDIYLRSRNIHFWKLLI